MAAYAQMPSDKSSIAQVAGYFLKLGFTGFGGPAAHIGMMHREVVVKRKWLEEQEFLDLLGMVNLIPGPNSTEMAIHIGWRRAGWIGLILCGICFIMPAALIVLALAWAYVNFGTTTSARSLLYGVQPVVIAIVAQALWGLGKKAVKGRLTAVVGAAVLILYLRDANSIVLLLAGGLVVMIGQNIRRVRELKSAGMFFPILGLGLPLAVTTPFSLSLLFLTFLKIGAVLYGGGYVLFAFLRADFVEGLGWLSDKQLLDAIAIGQVTPGPLFTTATFIGYLLAGVPGALIATLGIFLPSFFFVAASGPIIPHIRESAWFGAALDGVNVASLGLMAGVTIQLAQAALMDPLTIALAVVSAILLLRFQINSTWLIAGGAVVGLLSAVA